MRHLIATAVLGVALFVGCHGCHNPPAPDPVVYPPKPVEVDPAACTAMCDHIGPKGLNCPEGQPVYDSTLPGDAGVPNESCTDFCVSLEKSGIFVNPKCVAQVPSCGDIEVYRLHTCP